MMLVMAAPLYAVVITADTLSVAGEATITWDSSGDGEGVVAMGIDVDATAAIDGYAIDSFFDVFMDAAHDMEVTLPDSYNYGDGTPIADQDAAGEAALSANFAISMGILGEVTPTGAQTSGTIVLTCAAGADVTISENALRGGVVGESGADLALTGDLEFTIDADGPVDCFDAAHPDYTEWVNAGKPDCWCQKYQCMGDANDAEEGDSKKGYYWVSFTDIGVLTSNWQVLGDTAAKGDYPVDQCADFGRDEEGDSKKGYYRVSFSDIGILTTNWQSGTADTGTLGDLPWPVYPTAGNCGGMFVPVP